VQSSAIQRINLQKQRLRSDEIASRDLFGDGRAENNSSGDSLPRRQELSKMIVRRPWIERQRDSYGAKSLAARPHGPIWP
jgi:hypothetical protein